MSDQADGLRQLVPRDRQQQSPSLHRNLTPPPRRSLLLTSGKGSVGTSNLALNLAVALGELGRRVVLVDADLGLANLDLLCGLVPAYDLGDVLTGEVPLADAVVEGPAGITILPGAHGMRTLPEVLGHGPARLSRRAGRAGASRRVAHHRRGLGPWLGNRDARGGGRQGRRADHPRADQRGRRSRRDRPAPAAAGRPAPAWR